MRGRVQPRIWITRWIALAVLGALSADAPPALEAQARNPTDRPDPDEAAGVACRGRTPDAPGRPALELTPVLGVVVPLGLLVEAQTGDGYLRKRQLGAAFLALRVLRPLGPRLAAEAGIGYTPGAVASTRPAGTTDADAGTLVAATRAVLRFPPRRPARPWTFHTAAGVGLLHRRGPAWAGSRGTTDPAITVGAGAHLAARARTPGFVLDASLYISRAQFDDHPARTHHELVWTVGAVLPVARR